MCNINLCGARELRPLLERMRGTYEDHDVSDAREILSLVS
jgi:hypothetical protein